MSITARIPDELHTRLTQISGLLQIQKGEKVGVGEALEWVFKQLPEDYFEKLISKILSITPLPAFNISSKQKEKMIARVGELIKEGKIVMPENPIPLEDYIQHMDEAVRKALLPS